MKKYNKIKAFTIIELMVSIFITITIIASFYKLYEASVKTERSASIRVSVNLLGEQILDSISESMRMIGLNSQKIDLVSNYDDIVSETSELHGIFRQQSLKGTYGADFSLTYVSPYGSPITKTSTKVTDWDADATFPNGCKVFDLFNSAAFHSNVKRLYFHTQYGVVPTAKDAVQINVAADKITATVSSFDSSFSSLNDKKCRDLFPAGTLVTGEDFYYTLSYSTSGGYSLKLTYTDTEGGNQGSLIDFAYQDDSSGGSDTKYTYSMPHFVFQFLREKTDTEGVTTRTWVSNVDWQDYKEIVAVRFGFVILSQKERVYRGSDSPSSDLPEYCIFDEKEHSADCYKLSSLNYTASVFRRVVYLANLKMLEDSSNIK